MIHYHGLPITPAADMLRSMRARHAMVSFEDPRQIEEAAEICQSIVIDNGAFSAWRAKRAYDFGGYADFIARWCKHPCVDWHLTRRSLATLEQSSSWIASSTTRARIVGARSRAVFSKIWS